MHLSGASIISSRRYCTVVLDHGGPIPTTTWSHPIQEALAIAISSISPAFLFSFPSSVVYAAPRHEKSPIRPGAECRTPGH